MTSDVRVVAPLGLASSVPYAYAAVVPAGSRMVFLAGACPLDEAGQTLAAGNVVGQTTACLNNMKLALAASGADLGDVVFMRVIVASSAREDLEVAWDVAHRFFDPHEPPGTLQGTTVLGWPDQLVEVEVVAAVQAEQSTVAVA